MQAMLFVLGILGVLLLWPIFLLISVPLRWLGIGFDFGQRCAFTLLSLVGLLLEAAVAQLFFVGNWIPASMLTVLYLVFMVVTLGWLFLMLLAEDDVADEMVTI